MNGRVTTDGRQAVLAVRVLGPAQQFDDESGLIDAVIDTGFTGQLVLPPEAVDRLGLPGRSGNVASSNPCVRRVTKTWRPPPTSWSGSRRL